MMRELVYGVGVNDADYSVAPRFNGTRLRCKAYSSWHHILERAYSAKHKEVKPSYIGVKVCDEWLSFMSYRDWWIRNHVAGWHVDKDILTDERVYSPSTCIFIPPWLNTFVTTRFMSRGDLPIGVTRNGSNFRAKCRNSRGDSVYLGTFSCKSEAYKAWLDFKLSIAFDRMEEMNAIDERIYPRVVHIIKNAK